MLKVIDIEGTPNPDALKFNLNQPILNQGVRQFDQPDAGKADPVAKHLFQIPGVESVFYMSHFVTVTKNPKSGWDGLEAKIKQILESDKMVPQVNKTETPASAKSASGNESTPPLMKKVNDVIDTHVRPALAGDGGGLEVLDLNGYQVTIRYQGACGSCPSSTAGTMAAVQNLLQRMVDPRISVVSG